MDKPTRLIGGSYAGATYMADDRAPILKLPVKRRSPLNLRPEDAVAPITVDLELYAITRTHGDFNYGVLNALGFHEALDLMWAEYKHGQS